MSASMNSSMFIIYYFFIFIQSISSSLAHQPLSNEVSDGLAIGPMKETTHLHFYFQDVVGGKNPTAKRVINGSTDETYGFGTTYILDDPLTEGPNRSSKIIGRAQGMYSVAAQNDFALLMVVNYHFTTGTYNGSSLSILGRNHVLDDVREMPVVGGTGAFRFARGYALAHTVELEEEFATVEYDVYVQD